MSFFRKPSNISKSIVTLLLLAHTAFSATVHDLSKEFPVRAPSPDSEWWEEKLSKAARDIRRLLIIDDGEIVMEYQRDNVQDEDVFQMWSLTKPFFLMFMGMVIDSDEYDIDYNTTLGEIFTDDSAWDMIADDFEVEFKKNVTMWEMFVFQSGLSSGILNVDPFPDSDVKNTWDRVGLIPDATKFPNVAGMNLSESLYIHAIHPDEKGEWKYLYASNVLSYVMYEVTGMKPMEFVLENIFPSLGLGPEDIDWDVNDDGMHSAYSSMRLSARGIAKLTMLMMQEGKSSPDNQLFSKDFVETALSPIQWRTRNADNIEIMDPYYEGFRWVTVVGKEPGLPSIMFGAGGFMGQASIFSFETRRLVVVQRSNTITEAILFGTGVNGNTDKFKMMAMSKNYTFEVPETELLAPTDAPISGVSSLGVDTLLKIAMVSLSLIVLWL